MLSAMGPWPWIEDEHPAALDVTSLTDAELANLAAYRSTLADNTVPGHEDRAAALDRLAAVDAEIKRRLTAAEADGGKPQTATGRG